MSYQNILVPFDQSDHAQNALKEAIKVAGPDSTIHVIEIAAPPQDLVYTSINQGGFNAAANVGHENFSELVEERTLKANARLQENIAEIVEGFDGTVDAKVIYGIYIVETILDEVKHSDCDVIVMGCRGLGAIRGALGSVSYAVLRAADVPVLITK